MPPEAKLRMRNVGKYANTCSYIHILCYSFKLEVWNLFLLLFYSVTITTAHYVIHTYALFLISCLMTGTPLHRLVPIHSTRAGWDSLIHGQATRDIMMMTEYQLAGI